MIQGTGVHIINQFGIVTDRTLVDIINSSHQPEHKQMDGFLKLEGAVLVQPVFHGVAQG